MGGDVFYPAGASKTTFSVKDTYEDLMRYNEEEQNPNWKRIWKLRVQERVKTFLWLMAHGRLWTNNQKSRRGLGSAVCDLCGNTNETILHMVRDCKKAMAAWKDIVPAVIKRDFFSLEMEDWLDININFSEEWSKYWAVACHSLWLGRNKEMHEVDYTRPLFPISYINARVEEYAKAVIMYQVVDGRTKEAVQLKWIPPEESWVKLNTDGASKNNGIAGCGGIIRDHLSRVVGGFSKNIGRCNASRAELWGILEGLNLTKKLGCRKVELNVDSSSIANCLNARKYLEVDSHGLFLQIYKLMDAHDEDEVRVTHIYREANQCANALARDGSGCLFDLEFSDIVPPSIVQLVNQDLSRSF